MNINLPEQIAGLKFARDFQIEWGHCDPAGIVFHPRYFDFLDWNCVLLIGKAAGMPEAQLRKEIDYRGIPIVSMSCDFKFPLTHGQVVQIETQIVKVGRSSFELVHQILFDQKVAVECKQKRVWCGSHPTNKASLAAVEIPLEIANRLRG